MNLSTAKQVSSRDSATAALRKLGIVKADYDTFIARRDGVYYVDIDGAKASLETTKVNPFAALSKAPAAKADEKPAKADKKTAKETESKVTGNTTRISVAATVRSMIYDGMTNQAIWDALGPQGNGTLKDTQRSYPSWYRCEIARKNAKAAA